MTIPDGERVLNLHPKNRVSLTAERNAALAFREWLGGEKAINDYCHKLAMDGQKVLAEVMGTQVMDETGELTLNMVRAHTQ